MEPSDAAEEEADVLNLFCSPEHDAWRLYFRPTWLPRYLHQCLDEHGEAYPVHLDLEDLDRHMTPYSASYEKIPAKSGAFELTARGDAANALAMWLSSMFASRVRPRETTREDPGATPADETAS